MGLALSQYEAAHRVFPAGGSVYGSFLVALLPYVEQRPLYKLIDFSANGHEQAWRRLQGVVVPLDLCLTDPAAPEYSDGPAYRIAATSDLGNSGSGVQRYGLNGLFSHAEAVFANLYPEGPVRAADVRDGLCNTAGVCEVRHGDVSYTPRSRVIWQTPQLKILRDELQESASLCPSLPRQPERYGWRGVVMRLGMPWLEGDLGTAMDNHILPPKINRVARSAQTGSVAHTLPEVCMRAASICCLPMGAWPS